jgi:hypothetical protein
MRPDDASFAEMRRPTVNPDADPLALDEATLERLLTGDLSPDQAPPGYAEVAALLAATAAPPNPEELSGQEAALAELRAVTRARPRPAGFRAAKAGRRRRRRMGLAAAVVVGALATGGAAAAATGHLPGPMRDAARSILDTVGGADPATPTPSGPPPAPATRTAGPGGGDQGPPPTAAANRGPGTTGAGPAANPDMEGLCRAYQAGQGSEQDKRLDSTAFEALARAAGGPEKIAAYCQALQPGEAKPKDGRQPLPDDQGQGQDGPPSSTGGSQGPGPTPGASSPGR